MSKVIDLDILRPEPKQIKLAGHIIDVSYVPTGCSFEVDDIVRELQEISKHAIVEQGVAVYEDKETEKKAFDLTLRLCAVFCSHRYPEMDEDWFRINTSPQQAKAMAEAVTDALLSSYAGIEAYSKN